MKAMILAAGIGTRLRPLTDTRPKALVEINGRTLLEITIARLAHFGVTEFIINVHHFARMVAEYLQSKNNFGFRIELSREDEQLLDTGGGLKKAAWFFQENPAHRDQPFLLHNVDVISTIDLNAMLQFHKNHQALATLAVQSRPSSRQLLFNHSLQLAARASGTANPGCAPQVNPRLGPTTELLPLAFSGIHVISPRLLALLTETAPAFSIIDSYVRLSTPSQKILAFRHDTSYWRDLGKPADLAQAALEFQKNPPY